MRGGKRPVAVLWTTRRHLLTRHGRGSELLGRGRFGTGGGTTVSRRTWVRLDNEELHIDRGEATVEAGLTLPNLPVFTLKGPPSS